MTDCAWECDRVLKIVLCVNCWKGVFKLPPSGEICILGDFKYRQKIRKDRSDGENTPEIRGEKIGDLYPEQFDKVLLDTPCSGEGRFTIYNVQSYKTWSPKTVNDLTKMQRKLFKSAFNALKPNGTLVYSTCTLNKQENEEILQWALDNFNVKLLPINIEIKEALHAFNEGMSKDLNKAIRILPSKNMEGFFVSKFIKG